METIKEYPAAFPHPHKGATGMNLRDWFAGQALTSIGNAGQGARDPVAIAQLCYNIADAMLAHRNK